MPPLCKGRCPSAHTGAEGLGGRWFGFMKSNANSCNAIVPFRIGLYYFFTPCCPIPPPPLYTRGACAQKPEHGAIHPTAKYRLSLCRMGMVRIKFVLIIHKTQAQNKYRTWVLNLNISYFSLKKSLRISWKPLRLGVTLRLTVPSNWRSSSFCSLVNFVGVSTTTLKW